jgi:three-Cys-motif partner protein
VRGSLARTTFEFHFVERRRRQANASRANVEVLRAEGQIPHNADIHVHASGTFSEVFANVIAPRLDQFPAAPTFALVDPFGWTGLPMAVMHQLLRRPRTEVLVNFMFEEINRFLNHPDQPKNFDELVGAADWRQGYCLAGPARRNHLHDFYQRQLLEVASYVRSFEMKNERGASDYFLFFATNNQLGLRKMKEAMWRVDPGGGRKFSDMTVPDQLVLLQPEPDRWLLRRQIVERFAARRARVSDVEQFVLEHTAFHAGHYKKVLAELEDAGQVSAVSPPQTRRKGTFPQPSMVLEFS